MKTNRVNAGSLLILLASLLIVGCGPEAQHNRERPDQSVAEKKGDESTNIAEPKTDPLPKKVGDHLAAEFAKAADDAEKALRDIEKRNRELDKVAQKLAGLKEIGEDLAKAGESRVRWLSLMGAISKAITSVSGDPDKPVIAVENLSAEKLDDLSKWFGSLPESATAKLNKEDRNTPPAGDGWLMTLELSVDSIDENQKDKTLTEFAETLRNSKLPDKLRLTHSVLKTSGEKTVIEFVVRNKLRDGRSSFAGI